MPSCLGANNVGGTSNKSSTADCDESVVSFLMRLMRVPSTVTVSSTHPTDSLVKFLDMVSVSRLTLEEDFLWAVCS
jgi:hypothetical protein